jgi:hypothetical protein
LPRLFSDRFCTPNIDEPKLSIVEPLPNIVKPFMNAAKHRVHPTQPYLAAAEMLFQKGNQGTTVV